MSPLADDRGSIAVTVTAATGVVAVLLAVALTLTAGTLRAWPMAGHAADAAALAVMAGSPLVGGRGEPDADAGRRVARANGAALDGLDLAGWPRSVVVWVHVPLDLPWGRHAVTARAAATLHPS